jgi:glycosyltransferase involved in cell wall biosynthesis
MKKETQISIAIPYYNEFHYLKVAIESVLSQTITSWTLTIIDDNPNPDTNPEEYIQSLHDNRIQYHKNKTNLGIAKNWNQCLEQSNSKLVTILHSDDRLKNNYLESILDAYRNYPNAAAYYTRSEIINETGRECLSFPDIYKNWIDPTREVKAHKVLEGSDAIASLLLGNFIVCPSLCYNKKILGKQKFDTSLKQVLDLKFIIDLLLQQLTIIGVNTIAYSYRRRKDNTTSKNTKNLLRFKEECELYDWIAEISSREQWELVQKIAEKKQIIKNNLLFCACKSVLQLEIKTAQQFLAFRNTIQ